MRWIDVQATFVHMRPGVGRVHMFDKRLCRCHCFQYFRRKRSYASKITGVYVRGSEVLVDARCPPQATPRSPRDRKSTRLNSSHVAISYAVFCLKKKNAHRATA